MEKTLENIDLFIKSASEFSRKNEKRIYRYVEKIPSIKLNHVVNQLSSRNEQFLFWQEPALGYAFIAIDPVYSISLNGNDRIEKTEEEIEKLTGSIVSNENDFNIKSLPLFVGGLKFAADSSEQLWADYADSDWFIPKALFLRTADGCYLVTTIYSEPPEDLHKSRLTSEQISLLNSNGYPDIKTAKIIDSNLDDEKEYTDWEEIIKSGLKRIENGEFHKVVLSRQVKLILDRTPNISVLLKHLADRYPYCYIFAYRKNDSIFFGASPEQLAKFANGYVEADALAGSYPRGKTLEEDRQLEMELLNSEKNLNEQKAVVDFIAQSFSSFTEEIEYSTQPIIRKLPNIQHLWTPIKAKLKNNRPVFSFLKEVHPTPAICGVPWTAAMSEILTKENHNRGLYTGAIGWFNFNNEGEFAVAIRSALLNENRLYAFAGCGIVKGSDPHTEFEETKLKLKPILNLFDYEEKDK